MTDRIRSLTVALDRDIREDDVEPLVAAIRMLRGVTAVTRHVVTPNDWATEERIRREWLDRFLGVVKG